MHPDTLERAPLLLRAEAVAPSQPLARNEPTGRFLVTMLALVQTICKRTTRTSAA
jgi:hypothetical protein